MKLFKGVLIFSAGAAIGSVVTWKLLKTKYEQYAQEEIDSVKEVFKNRQPIPVVKEEKNSYAQTVTSLGYSQMSTEKVKTAIEAKEVVEEAIAIISPMAFGELDDYDTVGLTYYADGVLAYDSTDEKVASIEKTVGIEALDCFGEYEDDIVHVRNDDLKVDFEISKDSRSYSDVVDAYEHSVDSDE